jgi:hypothetical protein
VRWALLLAIVTVLAAPASSQAAGCTAISGSFTVIRSSAGAGNIVYTLRLHNDGTQSCLLKGLPRLRLLGAGAKPLPTHVVPDPRFTPKPFLLKPGRTATAKARFSPDVPGPGEGATGRCEPVAHTARVVVGGTTVVVPLDGMTSVCEHGLLTFTPYR